MKKNYKNDFKLIEFLIEELERMNSEIKSKVHLSNKITCMLR